MDHYYTAILHKFIITIIYLIVNMLLNLKWHKELHNRTGQTNYFYMYPPLLPLRHKSRHYRHHANNLKTVRRIIRIFIIIPMNC